MVWLPRNEQKELAETYEYLSRGESIRINHNTTDCQGDSKSMVIKRGDTDGVLYFKCYRCDGFGKSGGYRNTTLKSKSSGTASSTHTSSNRSDYRIPEDANENINEWPAKARLWIRQYGITDKEVEDNGIVYSASLGRVCLPVYDNVNGDLLFYQTRNIYPDRDTLSKYLTFRNTDGILALGSSGTIIVLVEDMLSAIKVSRCTPALCLFGTLVRDVHLKWLISNNYKKFIIWLDDDNIQVRKNALKNKNMLDKLGECIILHTDGKDPKEHDDKSIEEILNDCT